MVFGGVQCALSSARISGSQLQGQFALMHELEGKWADQFGMAVLFCCLHPPVTINFPFWTIWRNPPIFWAFTQLGESIFWGVLSNAEGGSN